MIPLALRTARKDVRDLLRARQFRTAALNGPWDRTPLTFVWQHHELFQWAGFIAARRFQCPLVLFVDAPLVWEARKWGVSRRGWGSILERVGEVPQLREADVVACVSEEVASEVERLGVSNSRLIVTPCAANLSTFHPAVPGEAVRARYDLSSKVVLGWIGSFRRFHGVDMLLHSFARLQPRHPEIGLLLVGDGLERARMEELARSLALRNVVFTGTVSHLDVPAHIAALDIAAVVDPGGADFHYSPLKLREYMAMGRPIVAPQTGQMARLLSDQHDALLVPRGDVAALDHALGRLIGDARLRSTLGARARQRVEREGGWDEQLERVLSALPS